MFAPTDEPAFLEVVRIAQRLSAAGYFLVSGGGPGAMEATNLGVGGNNRVFGTIHYGGTWPRNTPRSAACPTR